MKRVPMTNTIEEKGAYYNIGDRGTRSFAELKELYAGNGMVGFVAKERVDGKLILPEAVQILKMKAGSGS